ncbi:TPA: porin [Salmonella enterica]|nr:porin [Salmonella enterica]HDC1600874.1 porin [Salmonella enterica]
MKKYKTTLFVALFYLILNQAQSAEIYNKDGNKLQLWGKLNALHYFSDNKGVDGDETFFRMGINGETRISDVTEGYGQWEYQIKAQNTENSNAHNSWTRLAFAGLKIDGIGSLDYGRNYGVLYDIGAWTDVLPEFSGDTYNVTDNFMTGRTNNVLTYRNNDIFDIDTMNITLQYQGGNGGASETNNERSVKNQNGDGFGISGNYEILPSLRAGASWASSSRTQEQKRITDGNKAQAWNIGIKYDDGHTYLAAQYAETHNMTPFGNFGNHPNGQYTSAGFAKKTQATEVIAAYNFDSGLVPYIAYRVSNAKNTEINKIQYGSNDIVKYLDVAVAYNFNKNMKTYIDYKINLLRENDFIQKTGISTDNILALSLMYKF